LDFRCSGLWFYLPSEIHEEAVVLNRFRTVQVRSGQFRTNFFFLSVQVRSGPFRFRSGPFRSVQVPFRSVQVPFRSVQVLSGPFRSFLRHPPPSPNKQASREWPPGGCKAWKPGLTFIYHPSFPRKFAQSRQACISWGIHGVSCPTTPRPP
jgi:hypothetical protein